MDTKRDTRDLERTDRRTLSLRELIEAELMADPDSDSDLWDLLDAA